MYRVLFQVSMDVLFLQDTFIGKEYTFSVSFYNNNIYVCNIVSIKNMTGKTGKLTVYC